VKQLKRDNMSKELTTTSTTSLEMLHALRNTVAPGLTEPEFRLFAEMCRATGLNPATKEIWAIKAGGRLQLMTGINGFLKIANSHPQFDGMEVTFEWDGKQLISSTVKVYRKDRRFPSVATAYWNEYAKQTPIWKQMPTVMLAKCAKSLAIREAFIQELGGLYTAEEMPSEYGASRVDTSTGEVITAKEYKASQKAAQAAAIDDFKADQLPDWDAQTVQAEAVVEPTRAQPTYYDVRSLDEKALTAAEKYLTDCEAKQMVPGVWRAPIRLKKLTQCITEDWNDANHIQA
jgi:phage recombination protein Bet